MMKKTLRAAALTAAMTAMLSGAAFAMPTVTDGQETSEGAALTYPIVQTHAEMPKDLIERTGLDDRLLRLSVGLEDVDDLKEDLAQALKKAAQEG